MPHRPPHNNGQHQSMLVDNGLKDPLAPKKYQVLIEHPEQPGKWFVSATTEEPIEMLRLVVAKDHAMGLKDSNMLIVDEEKNVQERLEHYRPIPQNADEPITPENQKIRDRWIANVIRWLLPGDLWNAPNTPENQAAVKRCLDEQNVELAVSPTGTQVLLLRDGKELTAWSV